MGYFFDLEDFESTCRALGDQYLKSMNQDNLANQYAYYQKYGTYDGYKPSQETIVLNDDGSINFFVSDRGSQKTPVDYGGYCCVKKLPYIMQLANTKIGVFEGIDTTAIYWDAEKQSCRWKKEPEVCVLDSFKIVLNAVENDGAVFNVGTGEKDCTLEIDFNYLFKLDCEHLASILNPTITNDPKLEAQILALKNNIANETVNCEQLSSQIELKSKDFEASSYSIVSCVAPPFGYGSKAANLTSKATPDDIFCINEQNGGLTQWSNILGPSKYKRFLDGVVDSYTCNDVDALLAINNQFVKNNQPPILVACSTPFGYKSKLKSEIDVLVQQQKQCDANITRMQAELTSLNTKSEVINTCATPIEALESLDVSIVLDVVNSDGSLTTVFETKLLEPIGTGNLYDYLKDRPYDSGFYICGSDSLTGCTPLNYGSELTGPTAPFGFDLENYATTYVNVEPCKIVKDSLLTDLKKESGLSDSTSDLQTFKASLANTIFSSKWLNTVTVIDDVEVLDKIKNKKIKLSLKINNTCTNVCIYLDNIKLNRTCIDGNGQSVLISQSPGFHLERIIDNKKSWIKNSTRVNREFNIANNAGQNMIRQTDYDVNDERLVINTKEIDLDINIASAIENDVQCYINDNLGLLDSVPSNDCGCSESLPCYKDVFKIIPYAEAVNSGLIPSPIDAEDLLTKTRAVKDAWMKAWTELIIATGPYLDLKDGIYYPNPSEMIMSTYIQTRNAWRKALHEFNLASGGGHIEGLTTDVELNIGGSGSSADEYTMNHFSRYEKIAPQMFDTKCGRIFKLITNGGYMYFVETPTKELKVYWANTDYAPRNTTWIDITSLIQENYATNWNYGGGTPEKASYFCKFLNGENYTTWMQMMAYRYKTNGNTSHNEWVNPVEDSFFIEWDDVKGKCMTNMFKEVIPEQFSMHYPITSLNFWTNYSNNPLGESPQCTLDVYLRNSGTTACTSVDFSWPNVASDIDTIYRTYRSETSKLANEIKLVERKPPYYVNVIDPATNMSPDETSGNIPVKVTTTIRKGSKNGDIVYKEEYILNDPSSPCSIFTPRVEGLARLTVYVGIADPNSYYMNPNADNDNFYDYGCTSYGTVLTGNTSTLPIAGASENGIDRNWRFDESYYVHFDVVNNNTNEVYEVTNNDYSLKDRVLPIVCPTSASTQTFDINAALNSLNTHKTKMLSNIKEDLDYALSICTNC